MTIESGAAERADASPDISHLRVAVVSDAAPERNGVGAYYKDLIDYLAPQVAGVTAYWPTIENGKWITGMAFPMPGDTTQRVCFPNFWKLQRDIRAQQPDVMIIATPGVYGMSSAFLAARWKIPVITGFHTSLEELTDLYWHGSLAGRFFRQYLERSHRYLFGISAKILVNSREMHELAVRMGGHNVELVGTPIPAAFTRSTIKPYDGKLGKVIFAGRLAAEKNIESVIAAAERHPDIAFSIAGEGPQREEVESASRRLANLTFLGWLDRQSLLEQIDAHDLLVLPSWFESFGTIVLEAMARERPVIVSAGAGISNWPELAAHLLVMGKDESLASALDRLQSRSAEERQAMASAGREAALVFNDRNVGGWGRLLLDVTG